MKLLAALALSLLAGVQEPTLPELSLETFDARLEQILPGEDELSWTGIDWRPSLERAIVEARAADKPILLWAMNGHPLGCV